MRRPMALAGLLLAASVAIAGCGSDSEPEAAEPTTSTDSGIAVTGEAGAKPELEVPAGDPPTDLVVDVLSEGEGPEVAAGDYLVADYLGQTWAPSDDGAANVFDNSYDRGSPAGFPIGEGSVIPGWDEGLVGQNAGSRVLLVIPPDKAYGDTPPEGSPIEAGSTLVFIVDIVDALGDDATHLRYPSRGPARRLADYHRRRRRSPDGRVPGVGDPGRGLDDRCPGRR